MNIFFWSFAFLVISALLIRVEVNGDNGNAYFDDFWVANLLDFSHSFLLPSFCSCNTATKSTPFLLFIDCAAVTPPCQNFFLMT